jgi:hypothetical protein
MAPRPGLAIAAGSVALALGASPFPLAWTAAVGHAAPQASVGEASATGAGSAVALPAEDNTALLLRVRENLQRERDLLEQYAYRETRRELKISKLGKVSLGPEQTFDVLPSSDPDRPERVLVAIDGRPATEVERSEYAAWQERERVSREEARRERQNRPRDGRRRGRERLEDAFRVFQFETLGHEAIDGVRARVIRITPRPSAETRSDMGKWMKRFHGTAWVDDVNAELVRAELTATGAISIGWGIVGRLAEGTTITYIRKPTDNGDWLPAAAHFEARGRALLFRSFAVDSSTRWFDYRLAARPAAPSDAAPSGS